MLTVYDKKGQKLYTLDNNKEIARGGEGFLIVVPNTDLVAKIYLPNCLNINETKFNFLNKLNSSFFIKPQELLYDKKGLNIVGITMKYLPQDYFPLDVIFNKSYCLKHNINDAVKNKITKNLIDAINSAHNMNVEIGDLSGLNVMINNYGDVKLIDVDSYQVPGVKHSNKLLEDIRDYLYGGTVSKNSDYFSLSVLIFNYLTYLHPFKGIHRKISKLSERMIAKKPVFASDPDLIIPKCYEQIQNVFIQNQYEKLYINGDRLLLDFSNNVKTPVVSTIKQKVISEKEVYIQNIYTSQKIIQNSYFNLKFGFIKNEEKFIFYDTSNKGMIIERSSFAANEWKDFFVGEDNVVGLKNQSLYKIDILTGKSEEIKNFVLTNGYRYTHSNNLIILFENEYMWNLNIDSIKYNNIMIEKNNIYGPGFKTYGGIIQNVGGLNYIHLNIKNKQVPFLSRVNVHSFISINDVGFIKYEENKKIIYKYFNTDGGKLNIIKETDEVLHFAYKGKNNKDAILFVSEDNKLNVFRAADFYKLLEINCSIISKDTALFNTDAGIIAVNEDTFYLINKK